MVVRFSIAHSSATADSLSDSVADVSAALVSVVESLLEEHPARRRPAAAMDAILAIRNDFLCMVN
jgi:anti-sigma factor ChrR (cupin superfamily)